MQAVVEALVTRVTLLAAEAQVAEAMAVITRLVLLDMLHPAEQTQVEVVVDI